MNTANQSVMLAAWLFVGLVVCLDAGYRIGRRALTTSEQVHEGVGAIEASVFALLGLLLGFSFAGGTSRLDARRELVVQEANAIGTPGVRAAEPVESRGCRRGVSATRGEGEAGQAAARLLLPAVNEMIDVRTCDSAAPRFRRGEDPDPRGASGSVQASAD
jgi:hypothetical protein